MDMNGKPIKVGAQVLARWKKTQRFFKATVVSINDEKKTCYLKYEDNDVDTDVPCANIKMPLELPEYIEELTVKTLKRKAFHMIIDPNNPARVLPLELVVKNLSDEGKKVFQQWWDTIPDSPYPQTLAEFNYKYNEQNKLVNATTGASFHWVGQKHYDVLGDVVTRHIQQILMTKYGFQEVMLPESDSANPIHPAFQLNIFMTPDALTNPDRLLVLIQGSGAVRPGQWARALCINDSLDNGAMFQYIERAQSRGYGILILNPNAGIVDADLPNKMALAESVRAEIAASEEKDEAEYDETGLVPKKLSKGKEFFLQPDPTKEQLIAAKKNAKHVFIPGHRNCEEHAVTVWEQFGKKSMAKEVAIVAHSAGGYSTLALLENHWDSLGPRLRSVAFTDAVHEVDRTTKPQVVDFLRKNAVNWVTATTPLDTPEVPTVRTRKSGCARVSAGHDTHEYTSASAIDSVWRLIDSRSDYNITNASYDIPQVKTPQKSKPQSGCASQ